MVDFENMLKELEEAKEWLSDDTNTSLIKSVLDDLQKAEDAVKRVNIAVKDIPASVRRQFKLDFKEVRIVYARK